MRRFMQGSHTTIAAALAEGLPARCAQREKVVDNR